MSTQFERKLMDENKDIRERNTELREENARLRRENAELLKALCRFAYLPLPEDRSVSGGKSAPAINDE
jgi:transposase-like protein